MENDRKYQLLELHCHTKTKARDMDKVDIMIAFVGLGFLRRMNRDAASASDSSPAPMVSTTPTERMKNIPS